MEDQEYKIVNASTSLAHSRIQMESPGALSGAGSSSISSFFITGKKRPRTDTVQTPDRPQSMAQVAERKYDRFRRENTLLKNENHNSRMPRSKETEERMKILVLVTTAISIIVIFLFTITYPYINRDIGYDDGPDASYYCPMHLVLPPEYGRLDCSSVHSVSSVKVTCKVWCDYGPSNTSLNSTADGVPGVVLQISCLDSEEWGVSQSSLSSLCAVPEATDETTT